MTLGGCFVPARVAASALVPWTRLSRMRAFFAAVHRPAIFSPARWTTASNPSSAPQSGAPPLAAVAKGGGFCRSHRISFGPGARRTSLTTEWPELSSAVTSAKPIRPDDPLTRARIAKILLLGAARFGNQPNAPRHKPFLYQQHPIEQASSKSRCGLHRYQGFQPHRV